MPTGSLCAERNVIGTALSQNPGMFRADLLMVAVLAVTLDSAEKGMASPKRISPIIPDVPMLCLEASEISNSSSDLDGPPPSPQRRVTMRSTTFDGKASYRDGESLARLGGGGFQRRVSSRQTVIQEHGELNPLKPCGSCNEWLKKIAEPNPSFKVITFTDSNELRGIYVSPVLM